MSATSSWTPPNTASSFETSRRPSSVASSPGARKCPSKRPSLARSTSSSPPRFGKSLANRPLRHGRRRKAPATEEESCSSATTERSTRPGSCLCHWATSEATTSSASTATTRCCGVFERPTSAGAVESACTEQSDDLASRLLSGSLTGEEPASTSGLVTLGARPQLAKASKNVGKVPRKPRATKTTVAISTGRHSISRSRHT
jgi:hypothetical protein